MTAALSKSGNPLLLTTRMKVSAPSLSKLSLTKAVRTRQISICPVWVDFAYVQPSHKLRHVISRQSLFSRCKRVITLKPDTSNHQNITDNAHQSNP
jgi:hypothetical protein